MRRRLALSVRAGLALVPSAGSAGSATPPLSVLLGKYVPILVLHPAERLRSVRVDGFLVDSDLQQRTASGWEAIPGGPLPAGGAEFRLDQRSCFAVDGPAASPCYASTEAAHGSPPVVYGKAFRTKTRIDLQYWIWYPFNDYSATHPPRRGVGGARGRLGVRVGDPRPRGTPARRGAVEALRRDAPCLVGRAEARWPADRLRRSRIARELLRAGNVPA